MELLVNVMKMDLDGADRDRQSLRDFLIVETRGDQPHDLELARRQYLGELAFDILPVGEPLREIEPIDVQVTTTRMDRSNALFQHPRRHGLQHDPAGAEPRR